jgi:transcriptional regulator with GAF, ATPase, and Fis domain
MALIKVLAPEGVRLAALFKPVTILGSGPGCDVVLAHAGVAAAHAQVVFDGRDFNLEELDKNGAIAINGKKKRRTRLVHGDRVELGTASLLFSMFDEPTRASAEAPTDGADRIRSIAKLQEFSERLMGTDSADKLFDSMLEAVLEVTGAEKGFVMVLEEQAEGATKPVVRATRHARGEWGAGAEAKLSDTIVAKVLETGKALIVTDAQADAAFARSESVVALKLSSVMCAPLRYQGQTTGVIYVGNDRVKGLFQRAQLEVLSVFAAQASLLVQNALLVQSLREDKARLSSDLQNARFGEIVGSCASMLEVFRKLQRVATTDITVLITGETGTGKELIAREIHRRSTRANGPFVVINCGAIPENLIESELFGHARGAFTGAVQSRPGKFQLADKGTLFLDEVGELPLAMQVKLLRAIQERVVTRVGESRGEPVDIRIVAATNRVLEDEIKNGRFREDLYYRLNVVNLYLPPLRERGDDVLIIAKALLSKHALELNPKVNGFTPAALAAIRRNDWRGNIRQLENRIRRALVLCDRNLLGPDDLDLGAQSEGPILPLEKAKEEFQRRYVLEALERNGGNRTQTARDLGVDPRTIFRYLEKETGPVP